MFGQPNATTYRIANAQKYAYITFMDILSTIQQRWLTQSNKQKAIRFEKDPEWQPDDRVVLFQHFFEGYCSDTDVTIMHLLHLIIIQLYVVVREYWAKYYCYYLGKV